MQISLDGRHALVGGSSKGIGRAVAAQLAASGARVTIVARSRGVMEDLVAELRRSTGREHGWLEVDYTDLPAYQKTVRDYLGEHPVDILVNNTQGPPAGNSLEMSVGDYQRAFDLLFKSAVFTTLEALPHMQRQGWGRIINIASVSVREPLGYLALSNSIRAAVVSWGKTLAGDVGPYGITVNSVLTGYFNTGRLQELNDRKARSMGVSPAQVSEEMISRVPLGRLGRPEEYGFLAAFLASEAASYLTGAAIPLDGGLLRSY